MKQTALTFILLWFAAILSSQKNNKELKTENQQPYLVGQINLNALTATSYKSWYETNYNNYQVDFKTISSFKKELSNYKILVFMATWCGDSRREIPRFIKIIEAAKFKKENLKIVAVDQRKDFYKKSPAGEEWALNIKRVPTIIFYKNGKETNRIIESPIISLEKDIKTIVSGSTYIPHYSNSLHFD